MGAFTGTQARKAGLSQTQIDYRVRTKRWGRAARDVFVLSGTCNTWQQKAMVACLAGPSGTVANGARITGARVRRADLRPSGKAVKDRIPCTTAVQTVIDCSEILDQEALCELVDSALCRKLMQPSRLIKAAEAAWPSARKARRAGLEGLLEALTVWRPGAPPGSPPEAKLQRRLKEWGFPPAQRQVEVSDGIGRPVRPPSVQQ